MNLNNANRQLNQGEGAMKIEASWLQEALRRKAAVEAGEMAMIPGDEAIARLEALLA